MNFKYSEKLQELMAPVFEELEMKPQQEGIYLKDGYAAKMDYDEEACILSLLGAKPQEGAELEFITLSSYLFDESHSERDLKGIVIDFEETLREELGAKKQKAAQKVKMPSRVAAGQTPTMESFTKVFLDIFPQYKEDYRQMMQENEQFLYVDFYLKTGAPKLRELAESEKENSKQLVKYLNFLNTHYTDAEKNVVATISTVIFGGAFYDNQELFVSSVLPKLEGMPYLKTAALNSVELAAKDKKLRAMYENK